METQTNLIQYKRILIAVDETNSCKEALQHAYSLAKIYHSAIALLSVNEPISPTNFTTDPVLGQQPVIIPDNILFEEEEESRKLLQIYSEEFQGIKEIFTFVRTGTPREEILIVAKEWAADLIVLGHHKKTGLDQWFSGSVSQSVAKRAECPVLIVPKC